MANAVSSYDILITANSPGELAGWVKPVAHAFRHLFSNAQLTLILTPCRYASGREISYAKEIGFSRIVSPDQFVRWILKRGEPPHPFGTRGGILYLGGDLLHPLLIKRQLHYPTFAYTPHRIQWHRQYTQFFFPDQGKLYQRAVRKHLTDKCQVIGDLMVDSVSPTRSRAQLNQDLSLDPARPVITFFTGSRPKVYEALVPFYTEVCHGLQKTHPDFQCIFSLSPFLPTPAEPTTQEGIPLIQVPPEDLLPISTLLVTIPGTSTAQAATLGTPMLVTLPLHRPDLITLDGLAGAITDMPVVGPPLKQLAIWLLRPRIPFLALPNQRARRRLVPELVGHLAPERVAEKIAEEVSRLWHAGDAERAAQAKLLQATMGPPGAATKLVTTLYRLMTKEKY